MTTSSTSIIDALYGDDAATVARASADLTAADPTAADTLDEWRQFRHTLQAALDAPAPPAHLRSRILSEAQIELRLRETGGPIEDDGPLPLGRPTRWFTKTPLSARWGRSFGATAMLASAAMVLIAVTLAIAFDPLGVRMAPSGDVPLVGPTSPTSDTSTPAPASVSRSTEALKALDETFPPIELDLTPAKGRSDLGTVLADAKQRALAGEMGESSRLAWSVFRVAAQVGDPDAQIEALDLLIRNGVDTEATTVAGWADDLMRDRFPNEWRNRRAVSIPRADPVSPPHGQQQEQQQQNGGWPFEQQRQNSAPREWRQRPADSFPNGPALDDPHSDDDDGDDDDTGAAGATDDAEAEPPQKTPIPLEQHRR